MRAGCCVLIGVVVGFWLDDPADRTRTVTVTEEVEVPGPTVVRSAPLPDSCLSMIENYQRHVELIEQYADSVAPQTANLNRSLTAIATEDIGKHNEALTVQYEIELGVAGPLREIIQGQDTLDRLRDQCAADREEQP